MNNVGFGNGTACPECSSIRSSIRDKRNVDGMVWRNRVCDNGHKYRTIEAVESEDASKKRIAAAKEREIAARFKNNNTARKDYATATKKHQAYIDKLLDKSQFKQLSETLYDL
jgi:peptide methionine sulfoxide reductase MsrA